MIANIRFSRRCCCGLSSSGDVEFHYSGWFVNHRCVCGSEYSRLLVSSFAIEEVPF